MYSLVNLVDSQSCATITTRYLQYHLYHPKKKLIPSAVLILLSPQSLTLIYFLLFWIDLFWTFPINGIVQHLDFFCD